MEKMSQNALAFLGTSFLFPTNGYCEALGKLGLDSTDIVIDVIALLGFVALGIFIMSDPKAWKNRFFKAFALCLLTSASGCATVGRSTLFGAGVGLATGAGVGVLVERSAGSMAIGAAIGGVLGGATGFLLHRNQEKDSALTMTNASMSSNDTPTLKPAEATCVRTSERIEDGKYLGPRLECMIQRPAVFSR